ncbi:PAS domain S-box protein [Gemmata sp.]|uniref:PAS domain S-box protein n=1 Tax=Gemmata sp. TaxID=1914242 RepID=UPI003F72EE2E
MNDSAPDGPLPGDRTRSPWLDYAAAAAAVAAATLVRLALDPALGDNYPFATYFLAVAAVALFGQTRPAALALGAGWFLAFYLFVPPRYSLAPTGPGAPLATGLFLAVGGVLVAMSHAMRSARSRAERLLAEAVVRQEELRRSAVAEAEQRERLRVTLASIGDAVVTTDTAGRVTNMNAVAEALTGWANADAVGRPLDAVFRIVNESTRQPAENPAARAIKEGVVVGLANHTVLIARDGTERPIEDSAAPIRCTAGEVVGCVLVFRDVTERRAAEARVEAERERFRLAADAVNGIIYEVDFRTGHVERTRGLYEVLGYRPDEVPPTAAWWGEQIHPDDRGRVLGVDPDTVRATNAPVAYRVRHRDGRWLHVEDRAVSLKDGGSRSVKLVGCTVDVTARTEAERRVRASEERRAFLLGLSDAVRPLVDPVEVEAVALRALGRRLGASRAYYVEVEPDEQHVVCHADHTDGVPSAVGRYRLADYSPALLGEYRAGRTVVIPDSATDPIVPDPARAAWAALGIRAQVAVPLVKDGRFVAALGVDQAAPRAWTADEVALVEATAERTWAAVERARAEGRLRESEERYRFLVNAVPALVWSARPDGATDFHNDRWFEYTGLPQHDSGGEAWRGVVHPDDVGQAVERWTHSVRTGEPYRIEYRLRRASDGGYRWWQVEALPMRDPEGRVARWFGTCTDIHDMKRAEDELRGRETFIRGVLGSITDAFLVLDGGWRVTFANDEILRRHGVTRDAYVGGHLWELVPDAVGGEAYVQLHRAMADRVAVEYETFYEPFQRWFLDKVYPTDDGGLAVYSRDVTEQKWAAAALAESAAALGRERERLAVALLTGGLGVYEWRLGADAIWWSPETFALFGVAPESFRPTVEAFDALVHPDDRTELWRKTDESLARREVFDHEYRIVRPDGAVRWVYNRSHLGLGAGGRVERITGVAADVTARKRAELLQAGQKNVLEMVATNRPLPDVLAAVCRVIEGQEPGVLCSVLLADERGRHTGAAAGPSLPDSYLRGLEGLSTDPPYIGSCGETLDRGAAVVVPDVGADERFAPAWRELLTGHGLRSCRSIPVFGSDGAVLASFAVYGRVPGDPAPADDQLVQTAAHLAGIAIGRRRAEDRLRLSEERFRLIVESAKDFAIFTTDPTGLVTGWNAGATNLLGYDEAEVVGRPADIVYTPEDRAAGVPDRELAITRAEGRAENERWHVRKDGSRFWASGLTQPLRDGGHAHGFVKILRDVTDRRELEAKREATQHTLTTLVERCPFGIYIVDADFRIAGMNTGSQNGAFASVRPVIGRPFDEAIRIVWPEDVAADIVRHFRHTLDTGEPYHSRDFVKPRADSGRVEGYEWELHRLALPDGRDGVVCYYYDSTRLRRAEQELKEADQKKDEFLATLAHELRNPLAPIRNGLQVIKLAGHDAGAVERSRAMMERQVGQMCHLIDDLMDLARISQGKIVLQRARLRLADAVQDAADTARPLIEERGHELVVDVPPDPLDVDADRTRLCQVFANLLTNAAKYTEKGGRIRLAVERHGGDAAVSVEDNGMGIPADMLPRVFEMFTQVDRSLERSQGGLGIGLNIVKRLVEMHGGGIAAESDGPGTGSRFVVRLPVAAAVAAGGPDRDGAEEAGPAARRRILVVDDNVDGADSLATMLGAMGNETRTAHDGLEAVAAAEAFRPDVILMDIGMPKLNGYDACRRIRQQPRGKTVIVVAQTGWGQDDDKRKSRDAGFNFHMVKPVDPAALQTMLGELPVTTG